MKRMLGRTAMTLALANCLLGLPGCGGSSETPTATPPPTPAPPPAATYAATVTWSVPQLNTDGTPLTDVSGYRIYYGTSPASFSQSVLVSDAGVTSAEVSGLASGTYYFALTTINSAGVASVLSNAASKSFP